MVKSGILITALALCLTACTAKEENPAMSRTFEWVPTQTAPRDQPAFVIAGLITLANGQVILLPDHRLANAGWGMTGSVQLIGDDRKPAPVDLELWWYDLRADKAWRGRFPLPAEAIEATMRRGFPAENGGDNGMQPIDRMIVGMAPGGDIAVWLGGGRVVHEVALFQAGEAKVDLSAMSNNPDEGLPAFRQTMLAAALPQGPAQPDPSAAGRWRALHARQAWAPVVSRLAKGNLLWITARNGETDWMDLSGQRKPGASFSGPLALPERLSFEWETADGRKLVAELDFDAEETTRAFSAMAARAGQVPIQLILEPADAAQHIEVLLRAGNDIYRFERVRANIMKR